MSLRAFHILFIVLSIVLSAGCAWWAFANKAGMVFGAASAIAAVALTLYFIQFLRKSKKLIL